MLAYRFIVLDGIEGCGKSTQTRLLAAALTERGYQVVTTHEPGGTPTGERIRQVLLDPDLSMSALTEALLFCASRAQHLAQVIRPALADGKIVVCDRFSASTAAYQGYAGGLGFDTFWELDKLATGSQLPDMTIILDLDPEIGRQRKSNQSGSTDRIEQKPTDYHCRVRQGFLKYAEHLGPAVAVVDADQLVEQIHAEILRILEIE